MADGLLEAVRGLHLAHPELGPKPLLAKLRERRPDLAVGNKEVREALAALKAEPEESKAPEAGRTRSSMSPVTAAVQPADQPPPPQPALEPPGAVASVVEEPCTLSSLPAELLTLVAENLVIPHASRLSRSSESSWPRFVRNLRFDQNAVLVSAQSLASFAAASTVCRGAAQGELRVALVATVKRMPLAEMITVLRAHVAEAQVAEVACSRLAVAAEEGWDEALKLWRARHQDEHPSPALDALTEAGALEAVVEAMQAHPQAVDVHVHGCRALNGLCDGMNAVAAARTDRALDAGLLEAVVAAMQAHPQAEGVQERGCKTSHDICFGWNSVGCSRDIRWARRQRAVEAGALEAVVAAMRAHPQAEGVQQHGCAALYDMDCSAHAAQAGAIEAVTAAMQAHPQAGGVQMWGCYTLRDMCQGEDDAATAALRQRAADAGALEAVVVAMRAHPNNWKWGCSALNAVCLGLGGAASARQQRAAQAGAIEAVTAAMQAHPEATGFDERCEVLRVMCQGDDAWRPACRQRAVEAGALEAVVAWMRSDHQYSYLQAVGCWSLRNVCYGDDAAAPARRQRAREAGALEAVEAAIEAHPEGERDVQTPGHAARALLIA